MAIVAARGSTSSAASGFAPIFMKDAVLHLVLLVIFSALAVTAVLLRFWARKIKDIAFSRSDYLTVLGLIFALAETGINIYGCCYPDPTRMDTIPEKTGLQLEFLAPIFWMLAVTTIRAAIILLYIDHSFGQTFPLLYWTALAVNVAFGASTIIANCLICRPIPYRWSPDIVNGTCGDQKALDLYTAILNLVHDVVLVILPIPILWSVRVASTKRLVTICMFGIGIIVCAVTAYRVYVTSIIGDDVKSLHAQDMFCDIAFLTSIEALLGTTCACLPFLRPVLHQFLSEGRTEKTIKSFTSGSIPIGMHASQMTTSLSRKQYHNISTSATDSSCCEEEANGHRDRQGSVLFR